MYICINCIVLCLCVYIKFKRYIMLNFVNYEIVSMNFHVVVSSLFHSNYMAMLLTSPYHVLKQLIVSLVFDKHFVCLSEWYCIQQSFY